MIIALSGKIGSGKTTAAKYLNSQGFVTLSTRKLLADILDAKGTHVSRKNLQDLGSALILLVGGGGFVALMLEYAPDGNYVLDAIRYSDAIEYLRSRFGTRFRHIHLRVKDEIRYSRLKLRDENKGLKENYEEAEKAETELGSPELEEAADVIFDNEGPLKSLYSKLDEVVLSMKQVPISGKVLT